MAPPPPKVTVAHPIVRNVPQWDEYSGRLEAVETVDVKAEVSGFVQSVYFTEGAIVHKGDLLLTIDPQIFQAQLDSANAALGETRAKLNVSKATLQLAQNDFARGEAAGKNGGISVGELDTNRFTVEQDEAIVKQSEAAITGAEAAVKSAQQYVDWCKVTAPISGRISNRRITQGNMLNGGAGQNTSVITTITTVDPIYCYVDVDEAAVLRYQKMTVENKGPSLGSGGFPCYMELSDETGFPRKGTIDFLDNSVNPATATRRIRGVFPNPDGTLLPGFFARFRVTGEELHNALLVTDDCVGLDQDRKFIYVMRPDKSTERRIVSTGPLIEGLRVIKSGLQPDELVLVNGISSLAMIPPGGAVDPTVVSMPERPPVAAANPPTAATQPAPATTEAAK